MKKILYIIFAYFSITLTIVFAGTPDINCKGLPGCGSTSLETPIDFIGKLIAESIKYVAVIAVITLMISGVMYMISGGQEEKIKKAKTWIIWSLVGVLLSVSSWYIINIINNLYIGGGGGGTSWTVVNHISGDIYRLSSPTGAIHDGINSNGYTLVPGEKVTVDVVGAVYNILR